MNTRACLIFLILSLFSSAALAASSAEAVIKQASERFQSLLKDKVPPGSDAEKKLAATLTKELRQLFDIRDLAQRALVDHWNRLGPAERDEIAFLLQKLVERSYVKSLRSRLTYLVEYKGEQAQGDAVVVKTVVSSEKNGRPVVIRVDYLLRKDGQAFRVFDVVTDDVSMLKNYRSQFNRIIAKEGASGLLAKMRKKMAEK